MISELENASSGADAAVEELAYVLFLPVRCAEMQPSLDHGLICALSDPRIGRALNLMYAAQTGRTACDWILGVVDGFVLASSQTFLHRS